MAMTVHCDIVSAEKSIFGGLVEMVIASGALGDLGVQYGHVPLLTNLVPGPVRVIKQGGEEEIFYVSGGFLEVQPNKITVLADTALRAADIDEAAIKQAKETAEHAITNQSGEFDYSRATAELAELAAQIRAVNKLRGK